VNIARALVLNPTLVILDEPVSSLDKSVQAQVLNLLQTLKHDLGLTYLFISHDLLVIEYLSDRVLVMYLGQIMEMGSTDAVSTAPLHPYTQALFASAPSMNPDERLDHLPLLGDPPNPITCRLAVASAPAARTPWSSARLPAHPTPSRQP
jgi:peptide/nickel transport system ATP-binding protein